MYTHTHTHTHSYSVKVYAFSSSTTASRILTTDRCPSRNRIRSRIGLHLVPEAWSSIPPSLIATQAALREAMRRRLGHITSDDSLSDLHDGCEKSVSSHPCVVARLAYWPVSCLVAAFFTPLSTSSSQTRPFHLFPSLGGRCNVFPCFHDCMLSISELIMVMPKPCFYLLFSNSYLRNSVLSALSVCSIAQLNISLWLISCHPFAAEHEGPGCESRSLFSYNELASERCICQPTAGLRRP
ncbi:hypothetical protein LX36DRAFT_326232 [Colletotrichum falcatum]|nr:hypothetical protein LX36DRAFT_326232 [Colletotrichum falcatum]